MAAEGGRIDFMFLGGPYPAAGSATVLVPYSLGVFLFKINWFFFSSLISLQAFNNGSFSSFFLGNFFVLSKRPLDPVPRACLEEGYQHPHIFFGDARFSAVCDHFHFDADNQYFSNGRLR